MCAVPLLCAVLSFCATHTQGAPSSAGTGSLFLPEGAVGVFDLPSTWAVIQKQGLAGPPPMIDTETWIVMDLMDRGNLAAAIRQGAFLDAPGEAIRPVSSGREQIHATGSWAVFNNSWHDDTCVCVCICHRWPRTGCQPVELCLLACLSNIAETVL